MHFVALTTDLFVPMMQQRKHKFRIPVIIGTITLHYSFHPRDAVLAPVLAVGLMCVRRVSVTRRYCIEMIARIDLVFWPTVLYYQSRLWHILYRLSVCL